MRLRLEVHLMAQTGPLVFVEMSFLVGRIFCTITQQRMQQRAAAATVAAACPCLLFL